MIYTGAFIFGEPTIHLLTQPLYFYSLLHCMTDQHFSWLATKSWMGCMTTGDAYYWREHYKEKLLWCVTREGGWKGYYVIIPEWIVPYSISHKHIDGLVQERRNSSALAMELCLSCTNPLISCRRIMWMQSLTHWPLRDVAVILNEYF